MCEHGSKVVTFKRGKTRSRSLATLDWAACVPSHRLVAIDDPFDLVGQVIENRYRVDAAIGEGGFGVVYRGWHLSFEHEVAIKCLKTPRHFTAQGQHIFIEKFREEGKLLSRLSQHPSIVRIYDYGTTSSRDTSVPYMVLEWLVGEPLDQWCLRRAGAPLPENEAIALLRPAIDGLAFAHAHGIAHRDIKPANIFVLPGAGARSASTKLLDFGIAKAMQEGETATQRSTHTSSGFSAFSPGHGAPEQFRSKKFGATGPWTDVHAMGLVLTELMTGRPPFDGEEDADFLLAAIDEHRPTPRARGADVSDKLERVCVKALALMPAERFRDASELRAALDASLASPSPSPDRGAPPVAVVARSEARTVLPIETPALQSAPAITVLPSQSPSASTPLPAESGSTVQPPVAASANAVQPARAPRRRWRWVALLAGIVALATGGGVTLNRIRNDRVYDPDEAFALWLASPGVTVPDDVALPQARSAKALDPDQSLLWSTTSPQPPPLPHDGLDVFVGSTPIHIHDLPHAPTVLISKTSLRAPLSDLLLPIPKDAALGMGAQDKRGDPKSFYIDKLGQSLAWTRDQLREIAMELHADVNDFSLLVLADRDTPFRLLAEVIFTGAQNEWTTFTLAVGNGDKLAAFQTTLPVDYRPQQKGGPPPAPSSIGALLERTKKLHLTLQLATGGISVRASGDNLAPGCKGVGPGVTIGADDFASLKRCVASVKASASEWSKETEVQIQAQPSVPYEMLIDTIDAIRAAEDGSILFPDFSLGLPQ